MVSFHILIRRQLSFLLTMPLLRSISWWRKSWIEKGNELFNKIEALFCFGRPYYGFMLHENRNVNNVTAKIHTRCCSRDQENAINVTKENTWIFLMFSYLKWGKLSQLTNGACPSSRLSGSVFYLLLFLMKVQFTDLNKNHLTWCFHKSHHFNMPFDGKTQH